VVVGSDPGSKFNKAQSLGVRILNEDEFDALLDGKLPLELAPELPAKKAAGRARSRSKKSPEQEILS
jgi:BRCT domain type II-containing protein